MGPLHQLASRRRRTNAPLLLLLAAAVLCPTLCLATRDTALQAIYSAPREPRLAARQVLQPATFFNVSDTPESVVLMQDDGQSDYVKTYVLNLPPGSNSSDVVFTQLSSNVNVLPLSDVSVVTSTSSASSLNVTASLSFDGMAGQTNFTLMAANKTDNSPIANVSLHFTIAGMTLYEKTSTGTIRVVSGEGSTFTISYEQAASPAVIQNRPIFVFIQYPDGSTSDKFTPGAAILPFGGSFVTQVQGAMGQVVHNSSSCPGNTISSIPVTGIVQYGPNCGCGMYWNQTGQLSYGINFHPYRAGNFRIFFTWPGLTANFPPLSSEAMILSLNVQVTGTPPVTLIKIDPPETLLRPEGGELFTCDIINVDMHRATSFEIRVDNVSKPFPMIPGSYVPATAPGFISKVTFVSQPGQGSNLKWRAFYQIVKESSGVTFSSFEPVAFLPSFQSEFSYDINNITLTSVTPSTGDDAGGTDITILGYFPGFHKDGHGIFFSGKKIDVKYYVSVTAGKVVLRLPPRNVLGSAYEYQITMEMGDAISNSLLFTFTARPNALRISQIGTSEVTEGSFVIGDCSVPRFTAVLMPQTSQEQAFSWKLIKDDESAEDLLRTGTFVDINSTSQAIEFKANELAVGVYTLRVTASMGGSSIEEDIMLLRQNVTSIGAFLMHTEKRSIVNPDSPLRLQAYVEPPRCYTGNETMIFEWSVFGKMQRYSTQNATGIRKEGALTSRPARFGWEYVVPPNEIITGTHTVTFRAWMAEADAISGQSIGQVIVEDDALVAVIRHGEKLVTANYQTTIDLFASQSFDPNIIGLERYAGLSYQWTCRQSQSMNFTEQESQGCAPALISTSSATELSVPISVLQTTPEIQFLQYTLIARKNGRISPATTLVVQLQGVSSLGCLDDYSVSLQNAQGAKIPWDQASVNDVLILMVTSSQDSTWTFDLLEPNVPEFFSSLKLLSHPAYYSPSPDIFAISGNKKALALQAGALDPFTAYKIRVRFDANPKHEETSVVVEIRTVESPSMLTVLPYNTNGTTSDLYTAVSGTSTTLPTLSYYFMLTDTKGHQVCVGGCTGSPVTHFRIMRAGNYTLTGHLADSQGKALLATYTVRTNITVYAAPLDSDAEYLSSFAYGNDQSWTQQAHDSVLGMLASDTERIVYNGALPSVVSRQEAEAQQLAEANNIADNAKRLYCDSYPNTYAGESCSRLVYRVSMLRFLEEETLYSLMQITTCCVKNTPLRTIRRMIPWLPKFATELNRLTANIATGGNSRRRLLQWTGEPANQFADVQMWVAELLADVATSGKPNGFSAAYDVGTPNTVGHVSVVSATHEEHMPMAGVNGILRRLVPGPSEDELFFPHGSCLRDVFLQSPVRRRILVFQTTDNFVIRGFNGPPKRSNLVDKLYWTQIFERDENGNLQRVSVRGNEFCFCWRLPVDRLRAELTRAVDDMPGLFRVTDLKKYQVDVNQEGEVFKYDYTGSRTGEYNATDGWMEGCRQDLGLVSTTVVWKTSSNIVIDTNGFVLGVGGVAIVAVVVGAILLVVVATIASWMVAVRAMVEEGPILEEEAAESYVERDVYGRGSGLDSAVRLRSD